MGTQRNEKAIHDLQSVEAQFKIDAANEVAENGAKSTAIERLQARNSPLDRVNHLLRQGNLPVVMVMAGGELMATRGGTPYSIAKMSDGERVALMLAAEVASAAVSAVFLIDEPELHLHRSIIVPLLHALVNERSDCAFVISTHELDLPKASDDATVMMIRDCTWQQGRVVSWDVDVLSSSQDIPEWLRRDVWGSRRKILFIEGSDSSLDQPLYALLFPAVSIRPRASCGEVRRAVTALRTVPALHRGDVFGLIDNDGLSDPEIEVLRENGVYALPIFAVESLYYCDEILQAVADQQARTLGISSDDLMQAAKAGSLAELAQPGVDTHLVARLSERTVRDAIVASLPGREALIGGTTATISISVPSPYSDELTRFHRLLESKSLASIIAHYPVRESGALNAIARGLRFRDRSDFQKAALTRVGADDQLRERLRAKLGNLSSVLLQEGLNVL